MNGAKNGVLDHIPLNNNISFEKIALFPLHFLHNLHFDLKNIPKSADSVDNAGNINT